MHSLVEALCWTASQDTELYSTQGVMVGTARQGESLPADALPVTKAPILGFTSLCTLLMHAPYV